MRPICAYGVVMLSEYLFESPLLEVLARSALVCERREAVGVCRRMGLCSEKRRLNEDTESIRSAGDNGRSFKCAAINVC